MAQNNSSKLKLSELPIAIIGAGEIGRAVGSVLHQTGRQVAYWDKNPTSLSDLAETEVNTSLPDLIRTSGAVILAVPSWFAREALAFFGAYLSSQNTLAILSKGLDPGSGRTIIELTQTLVTKKGVGVVVVGGPMIAEELSVGQVGFATLASKQTKSSQALAELFAGSRLRCELSNDYLGVAYAGVLKNVYALGFGIGCGLGWGKNLQAYYLKRAGEEMTSLLPNLGGKKETVWSVAGLADLWATANSPDSLNRSNGEKIAQGLPTERRSEGEASLPLLIASIKKPENFPLISHLAILLSASGPHQEMLFRWEKLDL